MPQIFHRRSNTISKVTLFGSLLGAAFVLWVSLIYVRTYGADAGIVRVQPVPFTHDHHVGMLGIDNLLGQRSAAYRERLRARPAFQRAAAVS